MKMQALLLSAEVGEISLHDISTGEYKPGFGVSAKVVDVEAGETYNCQIADGFAGQDDLESCSEVQPTHGGDAASGGGGASTTSCTDDPNGVECQKSESKQGLYDAGM